MLIPSSYDYTKYENFFPLVIDELTRNNQDEVLWLMLKAL